MEGQIFIHCQNCGYSYLYKDYNKLNHDSDKKSYHS